MIVSHIQLSSRIKCVQLLSWAEFCSYVGTVLLKGLCLCESKPSSLAPSKWAGQGIGAGGSVPICFNCWQEFSICLSLESSNNCLIKTRKKNTYFTNKTIHNVVGTCGNCWVTAWTTDWAPGERTGQPWEHRWRQFSCVTGRGGAWLHLS